MAPIVNLENQVVELDIDGLKYLDKKGIKYNPLDPKSEQYHSEMKRILNTPLNERELGVRGYRVLSKNGISTVGDLVSKTATEILEYDEFGRKSLINLIKAMGEHGLEFRNGRFEI